MDKITTSLDTSLVNLETTLGTITEKAVKETAEERSIQRSLKRLEHVLVAKIWMKKSQFTQNMYQVTGL